MDKRKMFGFGIAVVALAGIATVAVAQGGPHGMGGGPMGFFGGRVERMLDDVNATPQQRQQIRAIADKLRDEGRAMHDQQRTEREQLLSQWEAGKLDRTQLLAQVDRHADQMKAFGHDFADAMIQVQGILTPEQRATIAKQMRSHTGPRHGAGRAAPSPPPPAPQQ